MSVRSNSRGLLVSLIAAASAAVLAASTAESAPAAPTLEVTVRGKSAASATTTADPVLKRLPAGHDELMFRGESASRSFTVQLGRGEAARTTTFQLALLNAVSLLPERSTVKLTVNGTVLAAVQAASPDKPTPVSVRIPPGLLVPGANTVRISAQLSHRVDCSVQATYELWALLEPSLTGFMVPREATATVHALDDLALEPLAADGTTRIHLRMSDDPDAAEATQAAAIVDAIIRRATLIRPVVDVSPERGTGAGFDVVIGGLEGGADGLTVMARNAGVTMARDLATNRLIVAVARGTDSALLATPPAGAVPVARPTIRQGFRKSFAELGLPTDTFAGRRYASTLDLTLPPDFLPSNDRARLLIDGSHSGSLVEGSGLVFRVNGTLVSSLAFAAGKPERFAHAIVELPLRFFHPGHNELSIEGTTSAVADAQCDTVGMSREARLTIAGSSELDFPGFAHLATLPQIPAAMTFDAGATDGATHLYVPATDRASLGSGLTLLANMATSQERMNAPEIRVGMPADSDPPGLVVADADGLPDGLSRALGAVVSVTPGKAEPSTRTDTPSAAADSGTAADALSDPGAAGAPSDPDRLGGFAHAYTEAIETRGGSVVEAAQSLLRDRGFFFADDQRNATIPLAPGGLVIAAVAPQTTAPVFAHIPVPELTRDASHWLVVTAASRDTAQAALGQLVAGGRWSKLGGEAVTFDPSTGTLHVLQPRTVSYVLPERLVLSDLRPILGGVMSDNIVLAIGAMLLMMSVLGVSTHVVIRRTGVR